MTTVLNAWRTGFALGVCCCLAFSSGCGSPPEGDLGDEADEQADEQSVIETLVTLGVDGSVTESSRSLSTEEQDEIEAAKESLGAPSAALAREEGALGTIAQPLVSVTSCSANDLWLYDASGNRLCVRWLGDMDRGLDLGSIRLGRLICGITVSGAGVPCTWAQSVTEYWPGQYAGHLGTCLPRDVGLSCTMPIAFPAFGPRTSVDGSQINWVTMPS